MRNIHCAGFLQALHIERSIIYYKGHCVVALRQGAGFCKITFAEEQSPFCLTTWNLAMSKTFLAPSTALVTAFHLPSACICELPAPFATEPIDKLPSQKL